MGGKKKDRQREIQQARQIRKQDRQAKKFLRKKMGKADAFKLCKQYLDYFSAFNKELQPFQVKLRDVVGDGSCLFRSFADQIDGNETSHVFMREQACKYMINHEEFFRPFLDEDDGTFEQYVIQMRKNGEWGGHLELQALSECFRCVIVIHKRNMEEFNVRPMTQEPKFLAHLGYFQHQDFEHYTSVREQNDSSQLPAIEGLKHLNNNMYNHHLEDPQEHMLRRQMEELEIQDLYEQGRSAQKQEGQEGQEQIEEPEPFPGYPRSKKCKCGSKVEYKNCCFKEWQKRKA